mgnify:CR=1 FL=1
MTQMQALLAKFTSSDVASETTALSNTPIVAPFLPSLHESSVSYSDYRVNINSNNLPCGVNFAQVPLPIHPSARNQVRKNTPTPPLQPNHTNSPSNGNKRSRALFSKLLKCGKYSFSSSKPTATIQLTAQLNTTRGKTI